MPKELPERMRCFIAIHVPLDLIERIVGLQRDLQAEGNTAAVRWIRPEQMHVTLKFLGDVPSQRLLALENTLAEAVIRRTPFTLSLGAFGCFPSLRHPSVIWVGLGGQVEALKQLQARVEAQTHCFANHQENREFHPHLTIGRVKVRRSGSRCIAEALEKFQLASFGHWTVSEVTLMRSNLSPEGAIHTQLAVAKLTG